VVEEDSGSATGLFETAAAELSDVLQVLDEVYVVPLHVVTVSNRLDTARVSTVIYTHP